MKISKVEMFRHRFYPKGLLEKMERINQPIWIKTILTLRGVLSRLTPEVARILRHANLRINLIDSTHFSPPAIEVLMTVHPKDNLKVVNAIASLEKNSKNRIFLFTIITTEHNVAYLKKLFAGDSRFKIFSEQESLVWTIIGLIKQIGGDRYGHILQQLLKIWHCAESTSEFILVFDSDTVLNHPTLWVNSELQSGVFPTFHGAFADEELNKFFPGFVRWDSNECYVSHHVVFRQTIVCAFLEEMSRYPNDNNSLEILLNAIPDESLRKKFIGLMNYTRLGHNMSEYDTYSKYALFNYPDVVVELRWSNITYTREEYGPHPADTQGYLNSEEERFANRFRSVSIHDHR